MNKQTKISLSAPQSRSSRMRMLSKSVSVDVAFVFGSSIVNVPPVSDRITFEGQDLTVEKYDDFFKKNDNYTNANFKDTAIYGQIFDEVNLDGADFTNTKNNTYSTKPSVSFIGASLIKAIFIGASLENASFNGANLRGVDFTGANLRGVNFTGANLRDAKFINVTNLGFANFTKSTLINVDFTGAKNVLVNTNFTDAEWTDRFNPSEWAKCNSYAFQCRNIDTVSDSDLKNKIAENPTRFCNEVMGRSCGDSYNHDSTFKRWRFLGGICRPDSEVRGSTFDSNCTTGCGKKEEDCSFLCRYVCQ
jgi:hypothetical protein